MIENTQLVTPGEIVSSTKLKVKTCSAEEAASRLKANPGISVLDVREPAEYEQARLRNSVNVSRGLLEWKIGDVCPDPNNPILIHCGSGGRAVLAAKTLIEMGYKNVTAIDATYADIEAGMGDAQP
jgi:rhodanese-related sulfurtransferase